MCNSEHWWKQLTSDSIVVLSERLCSTVSFWQGQGQKGHMTSFCANILDINLFKGTHCVSFKKDLTFYGS